MKGTQILYDEHENILAMLAVVEQAAQRLASGKPIPPQLMSDAAMFIRKYADERHHAKEEVELFPRMIEHGIPKDGGPIAVMLMEHNEGRALVGEIRAAGERYAQGDVSVAPVLAKAALDFVELLRAHIGKENNILYPIAEQIIAGPAQVDMTQAFDRVEQKWIDAGEDKKYLVMLAEYQKLAAGWS